MKTWVIAVLAMLIVFDLTVAAWWARDAMMTPSRDALRNIALTTPATMLLDMNGRPVFTFSKDYQIVVPLSHVSRSVIAAILSMEDRRFYDHQGADLTRIAGAMVHNVRTMRMGQGGSTITQQLIRRTFLSSEKTLGRKAMEVLLAIRLERELSKEQILEAYVNKVYFGRGFYGVEAASLGYFGKHASDLDVPEAAMLAGLLTAPSRCAPTPDDTDCALKRRNVVLTAMRDNNAMVSTATYQTSRVAEIHLDNALPREEPYGQYFKEEVRKQLVVQFGQKRVAEGGLRVYTTLDLDTQRAAELEVERTLDDIEGRRNRQRRALLDMTPDPLQAALVALDPRSGEVRAIVGGRNFDETRFNRAVQARRQPGSTFKPLVYAAALERGYTPASLIKPLDEPIAVLEGLWTPEEGRQTDGPMTMRTALRTSSNRAAAEMLQEIGIATAIEYAARLGVEPLPTVPSLALGSGEVTLMSMTAAFGAFANRGLLFSPTLIKRVETPDGEVLYDGIQEPRRAISDGTAFIVTSMLADVVDQGTASVARSMGFRRPAAGKTGTTNDFRDAWFIGYTPSIVTGVWIGYDQPRTIVSRGFAATLAVPLWARFMKIATAGEQLESFVAPANVRRVAICRVSGKRAAPGCQRAWTISPDGVPTVDSTVYREYFVAGTEPRGVCQDHPIEDWNSDDTVPAPQPPTPVAATPPGPAIVTPATQDVMPLIPENPVTTSPSAVSPQPQ